MTFDELQSNWQRHDHQSAVNVDAERLLQDVRRDHQALARTLWFRDLNEMGAAALTTLAFGLMAVAMQEWSLGLCAAGCLFVGVFFAVERWQQRQNRAQRADTLPGAIALSLAQLEHQIWLLRNLFWWYLLPLLVGVMAFLGSLAWKSRGNGAGEMIVLAVVGLICASAFAAGYLANQRAVRTTFEPRRQELLALQESLQAPGDQE